MKNILFVITIFFNLFVWMGCKNNPTKVEENINAGSREYLWTIDTIKPQAYDSFVPTRIWGSSDSNIWITGFGSSTVSVMYHYNGRQWNRDSVSRNIEPSALWGTANNNIWLGNTNSTIWKYDGNVWQEYGKYIYPNYSSTWVLSMVGNNANDVYAVGSVRGETSSRAAILHFDGTQWQFVKVLDKNYLFTKVRQQIRTGLLFIDATDDTADYVFVYDAKSYSQTNVIVQTGAHVYSINDDIYIVIGKKIYKYLNGELILWKDFSDTSFVGVVYGRSENDFFSYTTTDYLTWGVGHYNGTDFKTIYTLPLDMRMSGVMLFEKDIFVPCFSSSSNGVIVLHGQLSTKK